MISFYDMWQYAISSQSSLTLDEKNFVANSKVKDTKFEICG